MLIIANTKQPRKNERLNISLQVLTSLRSSLRIDITIKSKNSSTTVRAVKPKRIKQDMNRLCDSSEIKNRTKLMVRLVVMHIIHVYQIRMGEVGLAPTKRYRKAFTELPLCYSRHSPADKLIYITY